MPVDYFSSARDMLAALANKEISATELIEQAWYRFEPPPAYR